MKALTVGDLIDALERAEATVRRRAVAGLSREQWRSMEVVVRGQDEDGADFCGSLHSCSVEFAHDDDETLFLALDASNEPNDNAAALSLWDRAGAGLRVAPCPDHWHCDPAIAPHKCDAPNRAAPCPSCGAR